MSEQVLEAFNYVLIAGAAAMAVLALSSVACLAASFARCRALSSEAMYRLALTIGLAFLVGLPANGLWYAVVTDNLYHDADPVVRFMPFFPFLLDEHCGAFLKPGVSFLGMQVLWALFAGVCWLVADRIARALTGTASPNNALQRTRCARR